MQEPITIFGLEDIPEVTHGDDLAAFIVDAAQGRLTAGDIVVVAQKVVSKAEGALRDLSGLTPSEKAQELARALNKDPRFIQVVLDESVEIVRQDRVLIVETKHGFVCANAGVDRSNVPGDDIVTLLPQDSDRSAERLRKRISELAGVDVAIIVSDTFGRPWRMGLVNVALGAAGLAPLADYSGTLDNQGQPLYVTVMAVADELASAAELVTGKTDHVPVAVIRGFKSSGPHRGGRELIRPRSQDMFR